MSTVQSPNDEFENAKKQIRGLVGEIAQLGKSDLSPDEFYAAFLQRVVQALAADGGAVWMLGDGRRPQLSYQINLSQTLLDPESEDATRHARLLDVVVNTNQPQLIPPLSGNEQGGNPTKKLLVLAPLGHDKNVEGLIEIFQRPNTQPNAQKGYLKFLLQMTELASEWFKNRKLRQFTDRHSLWAQADQFARLVHDTLDFRETAYTIVNEGRRLIGCDRVSLCVTRGGTTTVEAISGQDTLDNRSNVVYHLSQLAAKVVASGETLWYNGSTENMPPQIEKAIESYVDESYTKSMVILPLRKPNVGDDMIKTPGSDNEELQPRAIIGALIVEQLESDVPREVLDPRIDLVYEHAARAMSNTLEHHSLFMMPVWKAIGQSRVVVEARNLPKTISISVGVLALILIGFLWPVSFNLKAKGALKPAEKHDVFATLSGDVEEVYKDDGQLVKAGEPLLKLRNVELDIQIKDLQGKLEVAEQQWNSANHQVLVSSSLTPADKQQLMRQMGELNQEKITLRKQLGLKLGQLDDLIVRSPIDGQVISWDVRESLERRPVQTGDVLMSVANLEAGWNVELYLPERRAGKLKSYMKEHPNDKVPVGYILMTDPGKYLKGTVKEVEESTFVHEDDGPCVRVKVELEGKPEKPWPNASLTGSATVGTVSIAYFYLHEAWEYLQSNWLFF